ncbi:MAG: aminotransferase class I/II-fold pyridoxal phosphate-dependent enzyme [Gaiellaceae bacterium]
MKRPRRLDRLPEQYFMRLLARVQAAAAAGGEPLVDLGRGNPDVPPPQHVVDALSASANEHTSRVHGYAPFAGLPELRRAIAARYANHYGVELDPDREVAVVPGTKTALVELVLCVAERGDTVLLPDPYYPDYPSGIALAGADLGLLELDPERGYAPRFDLAPRDGVAIVFLNYPSNPTAAAVKEGTFAEAVAFARETGAAIVHDFAYGDLVFDGREPRSFLAEPGAREVGVELFSMSKSFGMAGWRLGFVVGNEELVARMTTLQDHVRAGIFAPIQQAGIAALTGPQDSVTARVRLYEQRRGRVLAVAGDLAAPCEGTFYVWMRLPAGMTHERLLDEHRVVVAPGEGFGPSGKGWARLSLATPDDVLDLGLERLAAALR